jgi:hypothetical protein
VKTELGSRRKDGALAVPETHAEARSKQGGSERHTTRRRAPVAPLLAVGPTCHYAKRSQPATRARANSQLLASGFQLALTLATLDPTSTVAPTQRLREQAQQPINFGKFAFHSGSAILMVGAYARLKVFMASLPEPENNVS